MLVRLPVDCGHCRPCLSCRVPCPYRLFGGDLGPYRALCPFPEHAPCLYPFPCLCPDQHAYLARDLDPFPALPLGPFRCREDVLELLCPCYELGYPDD